MNDVQIKLSALWIALMLTYLLGDVLRIISGDFAAGEIGAVGKSSFSDSIRSRKQNGRYPINRYSMQI